jgi:hypothetical protein
MIDKINVFFRLDRCWAEILVTLDSTQFVCRLKVGECLALEREEICGAMFFLNIILILPANAGNR